MSSRRWTFNLFCTQRLVSASAVILHAPASPEPLHSLARQLVSEVCLRVGTESTNYHITQRDLPASQACHPLLSSYASIHPPSNANTPVRQWYQVTRVAAGPWELPTSCPTPTETTCDPFRHRSAAKASVPDQQARRTTLQHRRGLCFSQLASHRTHRASRTQSDRLRPAASAPDQQVCRRRRTTALSATNPGKYSRFLCHHKPEKYKKIKKSKASSG